ncbi:hypothetical protein, variant [Aphanomyces astaci]|uniref:PDZ domain-containing protein n=1 Tax=Aphanomyces astaci TaxID=112090 RepID=W4HDE3_APHAT|nr:hypothetical protein, variant [Aphanomyces astaci]ETV89143.1 hypothetical protein, variant [Aphanomyces astaci]|eukprot:XP_009821543.1 hypothetical protein, variant [Aphanomyces astaci]
MGFLDLFGPPQESRRSKDSLPSVASTRPDKHRGADTFQVPVDLNTAWRYFRHDLTSHHDAETSLADAPPAAFTLWSPRAMDVNLLHISIRLEHGTIEHSVVGVLGPGFHLVLPCLKADSNSHTTACGMCVRIVDLDVHLRIHHVHATVGCRVEHRDICIYERVPWSLLPTKFTSASVSLVLPRHAVFSMLRLVHMDQGTVVVSDVQPRSAAAVAGIRPGFRVVHVNDEDVTSVHQLYTLTTSTPSSPSSSYLSLHFAESDRHGDSLYQVTLHGSTDNVIFDWSRCGIKCRRVLDMVFVMEVGCSPYAQHCGIARGNCIVAVNGTRVPFMGFEAVSEFISGSPRFRLPLTLDLLDTTHEVYMALVDTERRLSTASLRLFHMDKATEQLRMLFVTVHSAVLVPLGLADVHDTCGLAALGLTTRRALLPFLLATSRRPQAPDFVRLVKTLQSQFRRASALGPVAAQFVSIVLYTCCCADDGVVSREAAGAFREIIRMLPLNVVLLYVVPLVNRMKTSSKASVRLASIGVVAELITRVHQKTLAIRLHDQHDTKPDSPWPWTGVGDMEALRWRHQMLEAGILFAELSTDNDPTVSCAARQYLPSTLADLMPFDVNWMWIVPLVEVLSKALMPDSRLDALYMCLQLAAHHPTTSFWRMRLAGVFATLANDGNNSIRKAAADKFVDFLMKIHLRELADEFDDTCHGASSRHKASSSFLILSDTQRECPGDCAGSAESHVSDVRRRCMSSVDELPSAEENAHILFTLLDAFTNLLQDAPVEMQKIACRHVREVAALFGRDILVKFLVPAIQDVIVTDMHECKCHGSSAVYDSVHHILARELCCVTPLLTGMPDVITSDIVPFLARLFQNVHHTHVLYCYNHAIVLL